MTKMAVKGGVPRALRSRASLAAMALALLLPWAAFGAEARKVAEVEGITEYRLDNGLRVLLFPDASKPTITVNVTYLVGSRHESYGETGMAHLLEHLLFKGTPSHPDIDREFNARGMRMNGTTSLDRTNYYERFQADEENLDWALRMEADRMVNSFVAQADLESEMTVVRNEYERGENSPVNVLVKRMQSVAYDWHNYGNSTIGNRSDIENVAIGNLQAFYRRYYQPDNAVLLVAGQFDPVRTLERVERYFGAIPRPERELPQLWTREPVQDGERSFVVRRVGDMQVVALGYKLPSPLHADAPALSYAAQVLADPPSGRLHKALVETGKAAQVGASQLSGVDGSLLLLFAVVGKDQPVEPVQEEMIRLVEDFGRAEPTPEEIQRVRNRLANQAERTLNDHERIGLQLSEYIALGDWRSFFVIRDRLAAVTAGQVQQASSRYLRRDNRVAGMFLHEENPQRAPQPEPVSVAELLEGFEPRAGLAAAEAFDPSPDNIDERTHRHEIDGMQVALLPKKNRGETVVVALRLPAGDAQTLFGQRYAELLTGQMLMRGTSRYTRAQLQDELVRLKVTGGVSGRSGSFETTRANVAEAIRLMAHVLREPAFPESEFDQLRNLLVTSIEAQRSDPGARAAEALSQHFNQHPVGDMRHSPTLQQQLDGVRAVTLEQVRRFHRTFYGADRAQISVVGDFDEAEVLAALSEGLGGWRSGAPWERLTSDFRAVAPERIVVETPDKENAVFMARLAVDLQEDDADYPALYLANYMLGGGAGFDSRLMSRIRVQDGLSYSVGSALSAGRFDRDGDWTAQAIAAPQNIDGVERALREELARMLEQGFTAEELDKAKSGLVRQAAQARAQDSRLASDLLTDIDAGRTFAWDKAFEARIQALSPPQVLEAVRRHIDAGRLTIVRAGDFARLADTEEQGEGR